MSAPERPPHARDARRRTTAEPNCVEFGAGSVPNWARLPMVEVRDTASMLVVRRPCDPEDEAERAADGDATAVLTDPPRMDDDRTVAEQVVELARAAGLDEPPILVDVVVDELRADALLDRVPRPMSRGERQIVGWLLALAGDPATLVVHEPLSGLDPARAATVRRLIHDLADERTVVWITDDPDAPTGEIDEIDSDPIDVSAWAGLELLEPCSSGHRNRVWRGRIGETMVAVRRSRRPPASLDWELDLLDHLRGEGFVVPRLVPSDDGRRAVAGVVVQTWLDGRPPSSNDDWSAVASELRRLHAVTGAHPQRPGASTVVQLSDGRRSVDADLDAVPEEVEALVVAVFDSLADVPTAVIHGDPMADNIRITGRGRVGFLDWDESRVDLTWHDLSNLGVPVLDAADHRRAQRLSDAWEAVNAWTVEPDYARRRLDRLRSS